MGEEKREREEERLVEKRGKEIIKFFSAKKFLLIFLGLIVLLILAWHTRTVNVPALKDITTNDYTLGPDLDPFLFLRYAKYIVENGRLMEHDEMRYVPLGYAPASGTGTVFLPYMIAYFHKIISPFTNKSVEYSAIMFPVFMFLLTVIVFFLLVRKVFEDKEYKDIIALVASAFLIVSSSLIIRTMAGIPEKEAAGFFFMFLAFYFFLSAWKSENLKKSIAFAFFASLFTVLMGLIWGGWIYVFVSIALFVFIEFIIGKIDRKKFIIYLTWIFLTSLLTMLLPIRVSFKGLFTSASSGVAIIVFILLLVDFLIFETKIKNLNFIRKLSEKIPERFISVIFSITVMLILSSLVFGISFVPSYMRDIISDLTQSSQSRLEFSVAENRQPYFNDWSDSFGPIVRGIPLLFWLFFLGSIFLFYDCIKKMEKKGSKIILTFSYLVFLFALIFSRYSARSILNGIGSISKLFYFGGFLLIIASFCYLFYKHYRENNLEEFKKINSSYLFLLAFFLLGLIGARSAVRLIMVLSIPAAAIIGYFFVGSIERARKERGENLRLIFIAIAIIVSIALLYSFYFNYKLTLANTKAMVPSMYTQQWQKAMAWVRDNTDKNAVFAHWWDYGYWVQSIGNRATILDGGNSIAYWDHLLGRHVLTGQTEREALEFLYAHNATHLLIDSTEIGKYATYSSIGSDENYDRYSRISVFQEDESSMKKSGNETLHLYTGNIFIDEDYLWQTSEGQKIFLPAYKASIGGVILSISQEGKMKQPEAAFFYQGEQINVPLRYIYYQGKKYDFGSGYGGALYIVPRVVDERTIKNMEEALFITEKSMRALWVKLYLFDEAENFRLVHKEENFILESLKNQGMDIGDFVFTKDIRGPIKIWEINYPKDIEFKKEYLETAYPESIRMAKQSIYS